MINPLDKDAVFTLTLANPNPTSSKTKDGPVYRVSFELTQDEWQNVMDADTKGMVIECDCIVTHRNQPEEKQPEKVKGGKLSQVAGMLCQDERFQDYTTSNFRDNFCFDETETPEGNAKDLVCDYCGINSRAQLDHEDIAAKLFTELQEGFMQWKRTHHAVSVQ